jgi:hypothetical protein
VSAVINGTHYWAGRYCNSCEEDCLPDERGRCLWHHPPRPLEGFAFTCPHCGDLTTCKTCESCGTKVVLF